MYGLTRQELDDYTVKKLRQTVEYASANSLFYGELLKEFSDRNADDAQFMRSFRDIPFTTACDLKNCGMDFLCVSPGEISRIVTLDTGGTTGKPKRIYFTQEDQQLTVDYFCLGMQWIVGTGDKVLILMPAKIAGSIGLLLARGLEGFGAKPIPYGLPVITGDEEADRREADRLLSIIRDEGVSCVVALPTHMRLLAQAESRADCKDGKGRNPTRLRQVLLSAEYVPGETVEMIEAAFGCKVYEHYGMTEMGLGCAVGCGRGQGYHIREKDLYIEIIDRETGEVIQDERPGEIVFTTLTRKGMPFIRYRTGDISRWILEDCPCGSVLKRIDRVGGRKETKGYLR